MPYPMFVSSVLSINVFARQSLTAGGSSRVAKCYTAIISDVMYIVMRIAAVGYNTTQIPTTVLSIRIRGYCHPLPTL